MIPFAAIAAAIALAAPAADGDGDGVPDKLDRCPDTNATTESDRPAVDGAGCPVPLVVITATHVVARTRIVYQQVVPELDPNALFVIDAIAGVLRGAPELRVEVGVHTKARGSDELNLKLTQQRADHVRLALIARGVDGARLTAVGYGSTVPLNPCCNSEDGDLVRANTCPDPNVNRRTELRIM